MRVEGLSVSYYELITELAKGLTLNTTGSLEKALYRLLVESFCSSFELSTLFP